MAQSLALQFLTLLLFFFMIGQGFCTRDLKVVLGDQNEEPYITQYGNTKPNYAASYATTKHNNHIIRPENLNELDNHEAEQPDYITGYRTRGRDSNKPYITSYGNHETKQPDYITGYRTRAPDSNKPYITSYGNHEAEQPDYITGYRTRAPESNKPYITSYGNHETKQPDYITGYRTRAPDSNKPYITSYGNHETKQPDYITGYRTHTHDSKRPNTFYGKDEVKEQDYITGYRTHTHESNGPYRTAYGKHEANQPDYITGYRTHTDESNGQYITSYVKHEANQPYITQYRPTSLEAKQTLTTPNSKDQERSASLNMDRTEAFKTGYFNMDDLYVGHVMTLQFPVQEVSPYLSKKEADSIPLSKSQLPSVLQLFSITEDSTQAKSMIKTLEECEGETVTGETKICANSLESMLEFVDIIIGSDTKHSILSTSKSTPTAATLQKYTILEVSHDIHTSKWVACHPLPYPYAIYYCHYIATGTKVFKVTLVGDENGDIMEALGICHLDTSEWNPDHIIFRQLGIKAGKNTPVCHFFPVNHLLWVPVEPSKATM
ncbi:unnamed protein product [Vicia faba]|uniref:BURP domain-containing protein n=1 Tax=Vicia faba TaxID=3906 RepID=A0AAV1B6D4_VICFA|nr:unnamed protein product [Vicia faba]